MINWSTILKAAGSALAAAAKEIEGSPAGAAVVIDAKKTVSDAATAALGYVQQDAAPAAATALTTGLTKIGVPSEIAGLLAQVGVSQGEAFLGQLVSTASAT